MRETYEALRDAIRAVKATADARSRSVHWLDRSRSLAVARDSQGRIELFMIGEEVEPSSPRIREHLAFDHWTSSEDGIVPANRLVLPSGDEYDAAASLICTELLERGFAADPHVGFARSEPVIEIVLAQAVSASEVVTGLAGELQILVALLDLAQPQERGHILDSWRGWDRSSRDFQLGPVGVEVKTTTIGASVHRVQGWYQVERGVSSDGQVETTLQLLSMGIRWLPADGGQGASVESLVQRALKSVQPDRRSEFIDRVRGFAGASFEIDAVGSCSERALRRPFMPVFERMYDFGDDRIRVPRSEDLAHFGHVQIDSVRFTVQLPEKVRGDLNPISGLSSIASSLLARLRE